MKKHYKNPIIDLAFLSEKDILDVSNAGETELLIEDSTWTSGGAS